MSLINKTFWEFLLHTVTTTLCNPSFSFTNLQLACKDIWQAWTVKLLITALPLNTFGVAPWCCVWYLVIRTSVVKLCGYLAAVHNILQVVLLENALWFFIYLLAKLMNQKSWDMRKLCLYHMQWCNFLFLQYHDVLQCSNHSYLIHTKC